MEQDRRKTLRKDFSDFILFRVDTRIDKNHEMHTKLKDLYDVIEVYKSRTDVEDISMCDDFIDILSDLLYYHETRAYKIGFLDGVQLPSIKFLTT